jgi:hypothetical protein
MGAIPAAAGESGEGRARGGCIGVATGRRKPHRRKRHPPQSADDGLFRDAFRTSPATA